MKSDLTCPVEIVRVTIQRETEDTNENGQILCLIDFFNLSDKVIDSIQMNIICFDAEDQRLGGRLVRAGAHGEPRENFSGAFAPEHVENVARVEAAVEKVWYQDGVIWRREERNVREYSPNALPPGRELDRLRSVAGPDAVGYAREDDTVWLCVCGRANRTSDDRCLRCGRDRAHTVKAYSFAAIDSTLGRKERMLEEKTRETLRRSSEQTVQQMKAVQKKQRKQKKRLRTAILLLALVALLLAAARWGVPYAMSLFAQDKLDRGLAADAKELYALIDRYWPDEFGAAAGMDAAEQKIIDGLMNVGTDAAYEQAALRAAGSALAILAEPELYAAQLQEKGLALLRHALADEARLLGGLAKKKMALVLREDAQYPPLLRQIAHPPHLLYVYGQTDLTDQFPVAVVGTRRASAYGLNHTRQMAAELANVGVCIVSGLALGIDAAAHTGALDAKGRTVAILGSALDQPYPAENRPLMRRILESGGSVVSEYPPGTVPTKYSFLQRNRIIAGMSLGTLVTEGPKRRAQHRHAHD